MTLERKFGSLSIWFFNSWNRVKHVFFWSCVSRRWRNFEAMHLMFKSTVKIHWHGTPTHTCSFWDLVNCVQTILIDFSWIFSTFSSVRLVDGRPESGWSSTLISSLLNSANHLKTCVWLSASSLEAFWSISCALWLFFWDGNKISSRFAGRYSHTSRFRERSLTTLGRIDNTSTYNLLQRSPPGYWLVKGATTLT